jgi:hypothetical protein
MLSKRTHSKWRVHRASAEGVTYVSPQVTLHLQTPILGLTDFSDLTFRIYEAFILKKILLFTSCVPARVVSS